MTQLVSSDIQRRALRDQVYDSILQMLLLDQVAPGQRLAIDTIARELNVSPTPVREALVHLEQTGLVKREALKGYRVAEPLDAEQIEELFTARLTLETAAAQLAGNSSESLAAELSAAHEHHLALGAEIEEIYKNGGRVSLRMTQEYFAADAHFHEVLFAHCGNRYLTSMYAQLNAITHRMRQAAHSGPADAREALAEHEAILAAFERGDVAGATSATRAHIEAVRNRSLSDLSSRG